MPVTAAVQPSRSTASARPPIRASIGAATVRSRSTDSQCRVRSSASDTLATAVTRASVAGLNAGAGPLTLSTPSSRPSRGSCSGAAAQVQEWWLRT